jgi:hypothetical protein
MNTFDIHNLNFCSFLFSQHIFQMNQLLDQQFSFYFILVHILHLTTNKIIIAYIIGLTHNIFINHTFWNF